MIRKVLAKFGWAMAYRDERQVYDYRYDNIDYAMGRPIHDRMSVAYPWARRIYYRIEK